METKHTPGPWKFDTPDEAHVTNEDYHVIRGGCGFLAEAKDEREPGFRIAGHMSPADARLIAAAPDLLEALQEVFVIGERLVDDVYGYEFVVKARAAIAKATGEAA